MDIASTLGPTLGTAVLFCFVKNGLRNNLSNFTPYCYRRCLDDIFVLFLYRNV